MSDNDTWRARMHRELHTQDNRITSHPIFVVQQRRRIFGFDPEFAPEDEGWRRTAFKDRWEFVTACLTEKGAQAYIDANGHNLREPRIYVESGWRNDEWKALRSMLMGTMSEP